MGKNRQKKQKLSVTPTPIPTPAAPAKPVKEPKKKKKKSLSSKPKSKPENIPKLLKLYSKEQIIDLVIDSALKNHNLVAKIQEFADSDLPHREIFVYGLSKSSTNQGVFAVFSQFGEIESCHVVMDKATGRPKGFAFIVYKSRKSAVKALKQPKKFLDNRVVNCQLASVGRPSGGSDGSDASTRARKIFVSNVMSDVNPEKLRNFFSSFGEIEGGPFGLDPMTGKCKGYALFVYKTLEGVKKVLEEPNKVFEGRHLHCRMAIDGEKASSGAAGITPSVQTVLPPVYAAPDNGQSMGSLGPNPNANLNAGLLLQNRNANVNGGMMGLNALPAGRFYGNPNASAGSINANPYVGHGQLSAGGMGMGGYNGTLGNYSLRGPDTMPGIDRGAASSSSQPMMQGYMNPHPNTLVAPRTSYDVNPPYRAFR